MKVNGRFGPPEVFFLLLAGMKSEARISVWQCSFVRPALFCEDRISNKATLLKKSAALEILSNDKRAGMFRQNFFGKKKDEACLKS
jgi:hypothetical protein